MSRLTIGFLAGGRVAAIAESELLSHPFPKFGAKNSRVQQCAHPAFRRQLGKAAFPKQRVRLARGLDLAECLGLAAAFEEGYHAAHSGHPLARYSAQSALASGV